MPAQPPDAGGKVRVALPDRVLTLADASGTSSSAYSATLDRFDCTLLSPHVSYWPLPYTPGAAAERLVFTDGGSLENTAIIPLLRRRVARLAVFINTYAPLDLNYDPGADPGPLDIDPGFAQLFGRSPRNRARNQVFSQDDFVRVVRALHQAKRSGSTVMTTVDLDVQLNQWWGVDGGWTVRVLWVYNDRVSAWEQRLSSDLRALIDDAPPPDPGGPLRDFSHYKTDFENRHELVQLTPVRASLLSHLSCSATSPACENTLLTGAANPA